MHAACMHEPELKRLHATGYLASTLTSSGGCYLYHNAVNTTRYFQMSVLVSRIRRYVAGLTAYCNKKPPFVLIKHGP